MHWGVDYGNTPGHNEIKATASGTVTQARYMNGYGNVIMIVHNIGGKTYESVYAHLAAISVRVGNKVRQGQVIGIKGTTGVSSGIHLHFEIHSGRWNNKFTNARNPLWYIVDDEVKELQTLLNEWGYKLKVDGIRGDSTDNAIKDFQKKKGLAVDGVVGPSTLGMLEDYPNKPGKGVEILDKFTTDSGVLKKGALNFFAKAKKDGLITSDEWLKKYKAGTLTPNEAIHLIMTFLSR